MLIALNKFISKFVKHVFLIYRLLRKESQFEWTPKCKRAFISLKMELTMPPVLIRPLSGELESNQNPIYFVSKDMARPKTRYQKT